MAVEDHLSWVWNNKAHWGCHHPLGRSSLTARIEKLSWTQASKQARQKCILLSALHSCCNVTSCWSSCNCDFPPQRCTMACNHETNLSSPTFLARVFYHCNVPETGMSEQSFLQLRTNVKCLRQRKIPSVVRMHRNSMIRQKHVGRLTEIA